MYRRRSSSAPAADDVRGRPSVNAGTARQPAGDNMTRGAGKRATGERTPSAAASAPDAGHGVRPAARASA